MDDKQYKCIQEVLGTLLYYARVVKCCFLDALGRIATQKARPTPETLTAVTHLLNYWTSNPEATVRYTRSDIILHIESGIIQTTLWSSRGTTWPRIYVIVEGNLKKSNQPFVHRNQRHSMVPQLM
jgi:hypothetical protein